MVKTAHFVYERLGEDLRRLLMNGPLVAADICRNLGISQPTFSRILARHSDEILVVGRASKTRYALRRTVPDVGTNFAIYKINEAGETSKLGDLHGIHPAGFYFASKEEKFSRFFDDLPYFIDDLRPNGFLGRLIPPMHPELNLPKNINDWSSNDCLKYLTRYGFDLIGNLILGDDSFGRLLENKLLDDHDKEYPKKAIEVLQHGDPGSSAGGEQPKFSAVIENGTPVLVKFSPKVESEVGQRYADLLICEHISLNVLNKSGQRAAKSALTFADSKVFLETERFDRIGRRGRKGLVSLAALDNEFVGKRGSWTTCATELLKQRLITQKTFDDIRWRETFGHLIGNTDMHFANISFFFQMGNVLDLAPAYDMLPMLYAPQNGQIVEREFNPPLPKPADSDIWETVWMAARDFWSEVSVNKHISASFQKIAQANLKKIQEFEHLQELLPL